MSTHLQPQQRRLHLLRSLHTFRIDRLVRAERGQEKETGRQLSAGGRATRTLGLGLLGGADVAGQNSVLLVDTRVDAVLGVEAAPVANVVREVGVDSVHV